MNRKILVSLILVCLLVMPVLADTTVFYAAVHGYAGEDSNDIYSTIRGDAGDLYSSNTGDTSHNTAHLYATGGSDFYSFMERGIFSFNTSSLSGNTVNNATFSMVANDKKADLGKPSYGITGGTLASNTAIAAGDYDGFSSTRYVTDITWDNVKYSYSGINVWTFNSDGLAGVNKTSYTILFFRDSWDIDNSFGGTWGSLKETYVSCLDSYSGNRPYLTVVWTAGGGVTPPVAAFTTSSSFVSIPTSITFTDTSTNTPTSWNWSMGDGTYVTTQNVTKTYTYPSLYPVSLTATNAGGSNTSTTTTIRVIQGGWQFIPTDQTMGAAGITGVILAILALLHIGRKK